MARFCFFHSSKERKLALSRGESVSDSASAVEELVVEEISASEAAVLTEASVPLEEGVALSRPEPVLEALDASSAVAVAFALDAPVLLLL